VETLFLGEIADIAEPLCLHSRITARLVEDRYGVRPVYLPFSVYREPSLEALVPNARDAARRRLGISSDAIAIVTFGFVHESKAPEDCSWTLEMLRGAMRPSCGSLGRFLGGARRAFWPWRRASAWVVMSSSPQTM
jgi:hypothetical protein